MIVQGRVVWGNFHDPFFIQNFIMKHFKKGTWIIIMDKMSGKEEKVKIIGYTGDKLKVETPKGIEKVIDTLDYVIIFLTYFDRILDIIKGWLKR